MHFARLSITGREMAKFSDMILAFETGVHFLMAIKRDPADNKENHPLYAWVFQSQGTAFLTLLSSVSSVCLSIIKKLNRTLRNQTDHTSMPGAGNQIPLTRKYTSPTILPSWCVPWLTGSWDYLLLHAHDGEGKGNPLQYPCLKSPMDRGAWRDTVQGSQRVGHDEATNTALLPLLCGEGKGDPLQCSCLENPMDRGAWWAAVQEVAKSQPRLSD